MNYYVYQYLRENGTPYYVGKGKGNRAWVSHKRENGIDLLPKKRNKIQIVRANLSADKATLLEISLISKYGRKDLGTGILRNMTNGGEGAPGRIYNHKEETKQKISKSLKGITRQPFTAEHKAKLSISRKLRPNPVFTLEHKANMRKPKVKVVCPHCNLIGGANTMKRYHFEHCKEISKT